MRRTPSPSKKKLHLHKEKLKQLNDEHLSQVRGGGATNRNSGYRSQDSMV